MNLGLAGKVALVTGGARDVGAEIARTLAREGAAVAVNYFHSKADADALVAEIAGFGGRASAYQADVADYDAATSTRTTLRSIRSTPRPRSSGSP